MNRDERRLRHRKARQHRAAARRLTPIRGAEGRRLRARSLRPLRMVGVGQFARGMTRPTRPRGKATTWLLASLPGVVLVVWIVARLTRHL